MNPLCRCPACVRRHLPTSTLRYPHRRPSSALNERTKSSLRLRLPYRVSPLHHRGRFCRRSDSKHPPLPRFLPLQRFPNRTEPHTPDGSYPAGYVAPSGYLTLPTLCSPLGLPSLFHPGPALGVLPYEDFPLQPAPYALSSTASFLGLIYPRTGPERSYIDKFPLQGLHTCRSCNRVDEV